jgi:hypothetical protein
VKIWATGINKQLASLFRGYCIVTVLKHQAADVFLITMIGNSFMFQRLYHWERIFGKQGTED